MTDFLLVCIFVALVTLNFNVETKMGGQSTNFFGHLFLILVLSLIVWGILIFVESSFVNIKDFFIKNYRWS